MADVEDSEARSREIGAGILGAEALHVTGSDGLLDGGVFNRQPLPVLHAAVQAGIHLHHGRCKCVYLFMCFNPLKVPAWKFILRKSA